MLLRAINGAYHHQHSGDAMTKEQLAAALEQLGLNDDMAATAALFGVNRTTLWRWLRGDKPVPVAIATLLRIMLELQEVKSASLASPPDGEEPSRDLQAIIEELDRDVDVLSRKVAQLQMLAGIRGMDRQLYNYGTSAEVMDDPRSCGEFTIHRLKGFPSEVFFITAPQHGLRAFGPFISPDEARRWLSVFRDHGPDLNRVAAVVTACHAFDLPAKS